jgi:dihydroorotate dehydrogenase
VAKARERFGPDFPLLATNGVRDGRDVARALLAGASAAQLGTAVWTEGPSALTAAVDELGRYLEEQGATAQEIIGQAADAVMTYEEAGNKA